jgi:hypothetical protein
MKIEAAVKICRFTRISSKSDRQPRPELQTLQE